MRVLPRGLQPAETTRAASPRQHAATMTGDATSVAQRTAAKAAAASTGSMRGRLAERMAEIANKQAQNGKQPPAAAPSPQVAPPTQAAVAPAPPTPPPLPKQQAPKPAPQPKSAKPSIKDRVQPEALKKEYQTLLHRLHERVLDAPREQLFFVPTKDPVALSSLTIASPNRAAGHDYRPVPCQVFDWALAQIGEDLSEFTFIDYGAGKGRALLLAAEHPFAAVAGVEFATELHDNAQMNIAQYPRSKMRCRNVECYLEDAVQVGPPEGPSVHFFFNPFSRQIFAEVLRNLVMAYRLKPRRLYLVLVDPIAADLIEASGVFARVEPSQVDALKLKFLSPYDVAVYRSLA